MKIALDNIRSEYEGFARLIDFHSQTRDTMFEEIEIDMSQVTWFDANMCSPFGALLYYAGQNLNSIGLPNIPPDVETILAKNGFLRNYGYPTKLDTHGTTIEYYEYKKLGTEDIKYFDVYIRRHLVGKGIPQMSEALEREFKKSLFEIFENAATHSKTELGIFTCGQYFPNKHRLDFSVTDLGMGIRRNVNEKRGLNLSAEAAISWATEGNTTKTGPIPGGLGFKFLRKFIEFNHGRMQIVSDKGYWEQQKDGQVIARSFDFPFPGTIVNIEIDTSDTSSYCLKSELKPEDVF